MVTAFGSINRQMNPSGATILSAPNSNRALNNVYQGNPENRFDFKSYVKEKPCSDDNLAQRVFFEDVLPFSKHSLSAFVNSEDDLGPEVVMNVKWLDAYRYHQQTVYLYLELIQ